MLMLILYHSFLISISCQCSFRFSLAYSGYSGNRETHWIFILKMNWFIETQSFSVKGFAPWPLTGAWNLSLIFQCPIFLKSSDLCWLAQLTWNASRLWSDAKGFLCICHLSWISVKKEYTLNCHYKTQPLIIKIRSASGGFTPNQGGRGRAPRPPL